MNFDDSQWMAQALRLAEKGLYTTSPNPRVGCVLVKGNRIVGEGWHERAGEPHAEVHEPVGVQLPPGVAEQLNVAEQEGKV